MVFLKIENIHKSFNNRCIINDFSYDFPSTGFVMLLGKSGSGKTTLLNIITGLVKKDKGRIIYKDKELVLDKDYSSFRKEISFVFQEYGIINYLSGYDNLFLAGASFDNNLSILNEELLNKKAGLLSGGEKQRLSLIKALSKESSIIFCDEPTGSLDEEAGINIIQELKKVSKNKLVIMVTHNEELAFSYGDEVLYLSTKLEVLKKSNRIPKKINTKKNKYNLLKGIFIALKSFFQDKVKLFLSFLSLSLTLVTVFTLGGLKESSYSALKNRVSSYADYTRLKVSKVTDTKIENTNFSLSKVTCPSIKEVSDILLDEGEVNYSFDSFFFDSKVYCNEELIEASVIVFPFINNVDELRINKEMYEIIKNKSNNIKIQIDKSITTLYNNKIVEDKISFSLESKFNKVYDEFDFFNYPVIYISQESLNNYLKNINLKNLSKVTNNKHISLYERYTFLIDENDSLTNYSLYIDIYNKEDLFKIIDRFKNYKNDNYYFEVESRAKITYETLSSSLNLLEMLMTIFSFISIMISIILMYLFINCMFEKRKKEFALYKVMGINSLIIYFYNFIPLITAITSSLIFSIICYSRLCVFLGKKLFFFFELNIFENDRYIENNIHFICFMLLIFVMIISLYPTIKAKYIKVNEVIKSE